MGPSTAPPPPRALPRRPGRREPWCAGRAGPAGVREARARARARVTCRKRHPFWSCASSRMQSSSAASSMVRTW
eukprot:scaffold119512_cov32-Phaeocystis_antarctica.AAC.1